MLQEVSTALEHLRREEREAMGDVECSLAMQHILPVGNIGTYRIFLGVS